MTDQRQRIRQFVADNPGVHFNQLARELDLATGQAQYHVRRLLGADDLTRREVYGQTHYFPTDYPSQDQVVIALARRETVRDILVYLLEHGPSRPDDVADSVDIARSTLEHHLNHLTTHDIVRKERDDHNYVSLVVVRPTETMAILETVDPSLGDRFVDRFIRLVDNLFDV